MNARGGPSMAEVQAQPLVEVGRYVGALCREQDRLSCQLGKLESQSNNELIDKIGEIMCDIDDQIISRAPQSVGDAAVLMLAISSLLHEAIQSFSVRTHVIDAWRAIGRVTQFLADTAEVSLEEIGASFWSNNIVGVGRDVEVRWWLQRFLENGGTLILSETGKACFYMPEDDADQAERFRVLHAERAALDVEMLNRDVGALAWKGMRCVGVYQAIIPGRRWAITWHQDRTEDGCVIATKIVTGDCSESWR